MAETLTFKPPGVGIGETSTTLNPPAEAETIDQVTVVQPSPSPEPSTGFVQVYDAE